MSKPGIETITKAVSGFLRKPSDQENIQLLTVPEKDQPKNKEGYVKLLRVENGKWILTLRPPCNFAQCVAVPNTCSP